MKTDTGGNEHVMNQCLHLTNQKWRDESMVGANYILSQGIYNLVPITSSHKECPTLAQHHRRWTMSPSNDVSAIPQRTVSTIPQCTVSTIPQCMPVSVGDEQTRTGEGRIEAN